MSHWCRTAVLNRYARTSILAMCGVGFIASRLHTPMLIQCAPVDSAWSQEYFLIDRDYYLRRPDLVACGRTLIGSSPPKGQSLSDQYFADSSKRMLNFINDADLEMWKLGIQQTTRHREVGS